MNRHAIFLLSTFIFFLQAQAQTTLPYHTGFDNAAEQAGWQQYRKGSIQFYSWSVGVGMAPLPSAPNVLFHDYPVGAASTDTTIDWYVSPPFNFSSGGNLDSISIIPYSLSGAAQLGDQLAIYLLKGSPDPTLAASVTLLADLTGMASNNTAWRDTGNFAIPATTGQCYVAIKYKATQDWFTPSIDNIRISGNGTSDVRIVENTGITFYPNPATSQLFINSPSGITYDLNIYDMTGHIVLNRSISDTKTMIDLDDMPGGTYFCQLRNKYNISICQYKFSIVK